MGEAPAFFADDLQKESLDGIELGSQGSKTAITLGDKIYMIAGADDFGVQIFNKCTGEWVNPLVLGTKPTSCKSHSALILNEEEILIIMGDTSLEDGLWFLETDTKFVREQKKKLKTEVVAWSKGVEGEVGMPIVISGPSGVGKGTLITKLMNEYPSMFGFSVSHTTRSPRNKEKDGVHYHFTERSVMEKDIKDGKFLEFASVHGNLYGTSVEAVEVVADAGKRCILDIDVQGARSVRASHLEAIFIFICPPSFEELEKRLRERGTETEEQIQKRLRNALAELEQGQSPGLFDHLLVNDNLENCYLSLKKLLGLDGNIDASSPKTSPKLPNLPLDLSVSKIDHDVIISCGTEESQMAGEHWYVLDTSSRKGGAPGRTRGLKISAIDPIANGGALNRMKKLS